MSLSIATTNTYSNNTAVTTHNVNLPASIASGDLLVLFFAWHGVSTLTTPTGWTQLATNINTDNYWIGARIADGSEGATVACVISSTGRASGVTYRITGNRNGLTSSEIAISANVDATTATPNPPSLTPSWGSEEDLWIAVAFMADGGYTHVSYPTNYTLGQLDVPTGGGTGNGISVASRLLNTATEDPGVFTNSVSKASSAYTLAIRPAAVVADFIVPKDYPNPLIPLRAIDLLTHIQALKLNLLSQDQFFSAPGQGPVYDYPNPREPLRSSELRTWINTQIPPPPGDPLRPFDWPNPQIPRRAVILGTCCASQLLPAAPVLIPFVPIDWPNPLIAKRARDGLDWTLSSKYIPAPTAVPFKPIEWPNPRQASSYQNTQRWSVSTSITLTGTLTTINGILLCGL